MTELEFLEAVSTWYARGLVLFLFLVLWAHLRAR